MKNRFAKISLFATTLALLMGAFSFLSFNKTSNDVSASGINGRLFVQITDIKDLHVGDTVMLGSKYGVVLDGLAGNPVFSTGAYLKGANEDCSKYYFKTSEALYLKVGTGITVPAHDDVPAISTFTFQSLRAKSEEEDFSHPTHGRYLTYGHEYSDEKYKHIQAYGDVNFKDDIDEYSSWKISIDSDGSAHIQRANEPYSTEIQYAYYGSSARNNFGYYTDRHKAVLYKEIDQNAITSENIMVTRDQNQLVVTQGEKLDLTGILLSLTDKDGMQFNADYEIEQGYFDASPAGNPSQGAVFFTYCDINCRAYVTIIPQEEYPKQYYNRVRSPLNDYRGTYVIGYQNNTGNEGDSEFYLQNHEQGIFDYYEENAIVGEVIQQGVISDNYPNNNKVDAGVLWTIECKQLNSNGDFHYYLKGEEKYLSLGYDENNIKIPVLVEEVNLTESDAVTIGDDLRIYIKNSQLLFNQEFNYRTGSPARLFKKSLDASELVGTFISDFLTYTGEHCDESGVNAPTITQSKWAEFENDFNDLEVDAQGYLANIIPLHNMEEAGSIRDAIDRYDYIVSKYNTFKDFMNRGGAGTLQIHNSVVPSLFNIIDNSLPIILIIVGSVALISLPLVFVNRKRKEQ